MNDDLEAELAKFRPVAPSAALERRLSEQLSSQPRPRRIPVAALLVWVVATTLLLVITRPQPQPRGDPMTAPATDMVPLPTYATFRHAFAESPEALDALLLRPDQRTAESTPVTIRSDLNLFH